MKRNCAGFLIVAESEKKGNFAQILNFGFKTLIYNFEAVMATDLNDYFYFIYRGGWTLTLRT